MCMIIDCCSPEQIIGRYYAYVVHERNSVCPRNIVLYMHVYTITSGVVTYVLPCRVQFGDDHANESEDLWAAIVACWPSNLAVVVRYLIITVGMYPNILLPHVSTVLLYTRCLTACVSQPVVHHAVIYQIFSLT